MPLTGVPELGLAPRVQTRRNTDRAERGHVNQLEAFWIGYLLVPKGGNQTALPGSRRHETETPAPMPTGGSCARPNRDTLAEPADNDLGLLLRGLVLPDARIIEFPKRPPPGQSGVRSSDPLSPLPLCDFCAFSRPKIRPTKTPAPVKSKTATASAAELGLRILGRQTYLDILGDHTNHHRTVLV